MSQTEGSLIISLILRSIELGHQDVPRRLLTLVESCVLAICRHTAHSNSTVYTCRRTAHVNVDAHVMLEFHADQKWCAFLVFGTASGAVSTALHSAKGGVVETRCSRLRFQFEFSLGSCLCECPACCSTCARHPLHPPSTAPPFAEYPKAPPTPLDWVHALRWRPPSATPSGGADVLGLPSRKRAPFAYSRSLY